METCAVCDQTENLKKCSGCLVVSYCGPACQKNHWKSGHKKECSLFVIKANDSAPEEGLQWIASRTLKPGTILLDELPIFHGAELPYLRHLSSTPTCLTCGLEMTVKNNRCSTCSWPVCDLRCENAAIHRENECKIFASQKILCSPTTSTLFVDFHISYCIMILRALGLKKRDPSAFARLMELQHRRFQGEDDSTRKFKINGVIDNLIEWSGLAPSEKEDCLRIFGLMELNAFSGTTEEEFGNPTMKMLTRQGHYIYLKASRINHSCCPNSTWEIEPGPFNNKIRIRTAVEIPKGQPVTLSYYSKKMRLGTLYRQLSIIEDVGFVCHCPRCLDPTELKSFVSAITCNHCRVEADQKKSGEFGYLLPVDPLNTNKVDAEWKCNKCDRIELTGSFLPQLEKIKAMIDALENTRNIGRLETFCDTILTKDSDGDLAHKNHFVLQQAAKAWIMYHFEMLDRMERAKLDKFVKLNLYLLNIADKLSPGISYPKALIQQRTFMALNVMLMKFPRASIYVQGSGMVPAQRLMKEMREAAYIFFKDEIPQQGLTLSCDAQRLLEHKKYM